jgi:hypothetical protein
MPILPCPAWRGGVPPPARGTCTVVVPQLPCALKGEAVQFLLLTRGALGLAKPNGSNKTRIPLQRSHVSFQRLRTLISRSAPLGQAHTLCACLCPVQLPLRVSSVSQDFDWHAIAPQNGILIIGRLVGRSARRVRSSRSLRAQGRAASYQAAARGSGAAWRDVIAAGARIWLSTVCPWASFWEPKGRLWTIRRDHRYRRTGVDLDRSRCARLGVGPCRVARVVVKETLDMASPLRRLPLEGQTTRT